jgi:hypothetical protein
VDHRGATVVAVNLESFPLWRVYDSVGELQDRAVTGSDREWGIVKTSDSEAETWNDDDRLGDFAIVFDVCGKTGPCPGFARACVACVRAEPGRDAVKRSACVSRMSVEVSEEVSETCAAW